MLLKQIFFCNIFNLTKIYSIIVKGQAETTELLTIVGMIVVLIVIIPIIIPTIQKTIQSFTSDSTEVISKDLASLISTSAASTGNIVIKYSTPSGSLYDVNIDDKMVTVSRQLRSGLRESSDPILIDAKGNFPDTKDFEIEKKVGDTYVEYSINGKVVLLKGNKPGTPSGPDEEPPIEPPVSPNEKSKLGIQTEFKYGDIMEFIRETKPVIVKIMNSHFEAAQEIKQFSPDTFIVGRIYSSNEPTNGVPEEKAQEWFNNNKETINSYSGFDCWEGYNEPVFNDKDGMEWFSRFELKRMKLLETIGKKACIGNFAVGNPKIELWKYFTEALSYASNNGHYLALHEYGNPSMQSNSEWLSLRHRKVYNQYDLTLPLVITETGIDTCGTEECGWKSKTNSDDFLNQLKWYDSELQKDSYVIGAAIFHYGFHGWDSFEISDLAGEDGSLTSYLKISNVV